MKLFVCLLLCSLTIALGRPADNDLSTWTRGARHVTNKPLAKPEDSSLDTVLVKHTPVHPDNVIDLSRRGYGADYMPRYAVFL